MKSFRIHANHRNVFIVLLYIMADGVQLLTILYSIPRTKVVEFCVSLKFEIRTQLTEL